MTAMRRAALILHALAPGDREWMLAQLDQQQRADLQTLLAELAALGVVRDPSLVREAVGHSSSRQSDDPLRTIAATPAPAALAALAEEPAAVIEIVLSLNAWPWRAALLDGLGHVKCEQVERLAAEREAQRRVVGHALRAATLEELVQRLSGARHEVPSAGWAARLPQWWRTRSRV